MQMTFIKSWTLAVLRSQIKIPNRIKNLAIAVDPKQFVWLRDSVNVRALSVMEESVRFPQFLEHFYVQRYRRYWSSVSQSIVRPFLTKVAVHRILLNGQNYRYAYKSK